MSKLREKFQVAFNNETINSNRVEKCEQIADDFAVKFAVWLANSYYSYNFGIKMFQHRNKEIYKTTTELLQIFKSKYYE